MHRVGTDSVCVGCTCGVGVSQRTKHLLMALLCSASLCFALALVSIPHGILERRMPMADCSVRFYTCT